MWVARTVGLFTCIVRHTRTPGHIKGGGRDSYRSWNPKSLKHNQVLVTLVSFPADLIPSFWEGLGMRYSHVHCFSTPALIIDWHFTSPCKHDSLYDLCMRSTRTMSLVHTSSKDKGSYCNNSNNWIAGIRIPFYAQKAKDGKNGHWWRCASWSSQWMFASLEC